MNSLTSYAHKRASQAFFAFMLTLVICVVFPITKSFAQTYSAPIIITKGGTYTGNWESRDSEVAAVEIRTTEPVIIENSNIRGAGYLIKSWGYAANLTVRHTKGYGIQQTPYVNYKKPRRFVTVNNFKHVVIENCYMESTAGIYVGTRYEGNGTTSNTVKIRYNIAKNIDGRVYGGAREHSQFVQFNFKGAITGAEIGWNQVINEAGNSLVEDNINIHNTRGTSSSPIKIHNNYIYGAYPAPHTGTTYSGGGIITDGDGDINTCPAYIEAHDNQVVNLGNYSMGIAGGNNIRYHHNRAVSSAKFKDGTKFGMYSGGLWSKDYYRQNTTFANSIDNNVVGITAWGGYPSDRNDITVKENASFTNNTHIAGGAITQAMEAEEFSRWTQKLQQNGIVLGPNGTSGTVTTNQAPNVAIASPTAGASFTAGNTITLSANASDADGSVTRVEYFAGATKIGEAANAPYTFNWTSAAAGSYSLTAKATDDKGATKVSNAVSITVATSNTATTAPTTTITGGTGKITREFWSGVYGTSVSVIPVGTKPTSVTELTSFEAPTGQGNNYGQRVRG
ncbi:Ig-like domain-containing protein, partial [Pontibacter aydingkolensis]